MWLVEAVIAGGLTAAGLRVLVAYFAAQRVRRMPVVRRVPLIGVRPPAAPPREEGADLLAYPERLRTLEDRLIERHHAVQDQLQVMVARRSEVAAKGGREDLAKKYDADMSMLER